MATTPNFNWSTPDNTGLVKNGALDIRTLGNSIDASLVDLKGGTTGQVLAKQTNTDMDFTWSTPSSGSSYVAGKNFTINGGFDIWQRGTSFSSAANIYSADRWLIYRNGANLTTSRIATGDTTNLPNIQYAARLQRTASSTNTDIVYFMNMYETVNTIPLVGQTVTLSFYARRGANYSATSNILTASVRTGTGTDQNWISGYTSEATPLTTNATLTTTWQRFTVSGTIATTANELTVLFQFTPTGTAGAADLVDITGVQLEVSASATAFSRACGTIQGELAACQRYFQILGGNVASERLATIASTSSSTWSGGLYFPTQMRTAPTLTFAGTFTFRDDGNRTISSTNSGNISKNSAEIYGNGTGWSGTYTPATMVASNTSTTISISAEL